MYLQPKDIYLQPKDRVFLGSFYFFDRLLELYPGRKQEVLPCFLTDIRNIFPPFAKKSQFLFLTLKPD